MQPFLLEEKLPQQTHEGCIHAHFIMGIIGNLAYYLLNDQTLHSLLVHEPKVKFTMIHKVLLCHE